MKRWVNALRIPDENEIDKTLCMQKGELEGQLQDSKVKSPQVHSEIEGLNERCQNSSSALRRVSSSVSFRRKGANVWDRVNLGLESFGLAGLKLSARGPEMDDIQRVVIDLLFLLKQKEKSIDELNDGLLRNSKDLTKLLDENQILKGGSGRKNLLSNFRKKIRKQSDTDVFWKFMKRDYRENKEGDTQILEIIREYRTRISELEDKSLACEKNKKINVMLRKLGASNLDEGAGVVDQLKDAISMFPRIESTMRGVICEILGEAEPGNWGNDVNRVVEVIRKNNKELKELKLFKNKIFMYLNHDKNIKLEDVYRQCRNFTQVERLYRKLKGREYERIEEVYGLTDEIIEFISTLRKHLELPDNVSLRDIFKYANNKLR